MKTTKTHIRLFALVLAVFIMLPLGCVKTDAANGLSPAQEKFLADMGDIASKVMKESRVLASVTIAQAIWESSWGQSSLTKKTNNYFGFTVGSSWTGPIYCSKNDSFYSNREEAIAILGSSKYNYWAGGGDNGVPGFWRVYSDMEASVRDHNEQLATSKYYEGIPGETDYKVVCKILNKYYCTDDSYATAIIKTIETYELYQYDSTMVNADTPTSLVLDVKSLVMSIGDSYPVTASVYPSSAKDKTVIFSSSDSSVATVSAAGVIKAVKAGTAVITAKTSNGIKCEISVYCSKDGEITYTGTIVKSVYCRASKADNAEKLGVFGVGTEIMIHGDSEDGTWYHVSGTNQAGDNVSGYIYMTCVSNVKPYVAPDPLPQGKKYKGTVTYAVYVRTEPNADTSEKLGIIPIGREVIVFGEKDGEFYYAAGRSENGTELTGYVYAECIRIDGELVEGDQQLSGDDGINYRFATTVSALNCRKGPGTDNDLLGTFEAGATVIICGEGVSGENIDGTWYYVKGIDKNGDAVTGYCGGDYLRLGDTVASSAGLEIDGTYIYGIAPKTEVGSLAANNSRIKFTVTNANGDVMTSDRFIGTGCIVSVSFDGINLFAKTAIVAGDADGDGKISASDYLRIRRHILGTYTLDEVFFKASDMNSDGKVAAADYIKVRRIILGIV